MRNALLALALVFALVTAAPSARAEDPSLSAARRSYVQDRGGLMSALTAWAAINVIGGPILFATAPPSSPQTQARREFQRSFGSMALAYGLVNGALAIATLATLSKTRAELVTGGDVIEHRRQSSNVFAVNVGLDMLSVGVGAAIWAGTSSPRGQGAGASVVAQGLFLVGFDTIGTVVYRY